jgi:hypothetical protein
MTTGALPATPKQLAFLRRLNVGHEPGLTRSQAGGLIYDELRRRGELPVRENRSGAWTERQRAVISALVDEVGAVYPTGPLTVRQADAFIQGLLSRKRLGLLGRAVNDPRAVVAAQQQEEEVR